jgi:hypothetical protein
MLHSINAEGYSKATQWCGPGALSSLTGLPIRESTELLCRIHGGTYEEFEGCWVEDVILALHELGYKAKQVDIMARYPKLTHGPTLQRFLSERRVDECVNPLLIEISGHFVSSHFGYASDNWTGRPVPIQKFPKLGRLVKDAYIVTKGAQ